MFKSKTGILIFFLLGIWLCLCLCWTGNAAASPRYSIKFATVPPEGSTWIKHLRTIDKDIRKKSSGQLGFRIYAGGIAGDELDVLKKIRIGQIHSTAFSGVGFGQILPMVRVLDLPFLFRNNKEIDLVHRKLRDFFSRAFRKKGFELLGWAEVGNVHLFSKKPIRSVNDFSGLKVWTWSGDPIAKETFSAMGVNPIPLAITDVTTAINTGMIDTVYAPPLGALALQWHSSMNYMTALPFVHSTGAALISLKYLNKLPDNLSGLLVGTFNRSMNDLTLILRKQNKKAVEVIKNCGIKIIPAPSGDALEQFYSIHGQVARKLTGKIYPKDVLDSVYEILKRPH